MKAIIFIGITLVYLCIKLYLRKRVDSTPVLSDNERLTNLALARNQSVYEIFHCAARTWTIPDQNVKDHFKQFVQSGELPHYVRDFLRRESSRQDLKARTRLYPGGELPPSWSA